MGDGEILTAVAVPRDREGWSHLYRPSVAELHDFAGMLGDDDYPDLVLPETE